MRHAIELERAVDLSGDRHRLEVHLDGSLYVATVDGSVALSARLYDRPTGRVGFFVTDGEVDLSSFEVRT